MLPRYLLFIASFVVGVIAVHTQASLAPWWAALPFALFAVLLLSILSLKRVRSEWGVIFSLMLLAASLGFTWSNGAAIYRMAQRIPINWVGQTVLMTGKVSNLPQAGRFGQRFMFTPDAMAAGAWLPEQIQINADEKYGHFTAGERWRLSLKLKPIHGAVNVAGFDLESWFLQQNIAAIGNVKSAERIADASHLMSILAIRSALRERMVRSLGSAPYAGVIIALTIGDQGQIPPEQWQRYAQTGITHLISISGLHITLLAALGAGIMRVVWRFVLARRVALSHISVQRVALITGVIVALAYSLLAGWSVPTQRTVLMVAAAALWRARPMPVSAIWASALLIVLLFDPFAVLSIGFWLSFIAVGFLIWSGANHIGERRKIHLWVSTQWAASLATLPILVMIFGQFPMISPLANALAIPVVSIVITPLALAGLIDPTGTLLHWAERLMAYLDIFLQFCTRLPIWQISFTPPTLGMMLLALLGVALLLLPRGFQGRWFAWLMLLPLVLSPKETIKNTEFDVQVLDVGQGLSVLLQTRQHTLMFDTGSAPNGQAVLLPVLRRMGVTAIDTLVLSHNDNDHVGAAGELLAQQRIAIHMIRHSLPANHPYLLSTQTVALSAACQAGQAWDWDGVHFAMLWLRSDYPANSDNAKGCVLRIDNGRHSLLIPADIGRREEVELLAANLPATDIVIAPHHGSKNSSSEVFVAALKPQYAVFSAGFMNHFGHPKAEIEARYAAYGAQLLRTDTMGAIRFHVGEQISVQQQRAISPRYWYTAVSQIEPISAGITP